MSLNGSTAGVSIGHEKGRSPTASVTMPGDLRDMTGIASGPITIPYQMYGQHEPSEVVSSPSVVGVGNTHTISIRNGVPNGVVSFSGTYSGTITLDSTGAGSISETPSSAVPFTINFNFSLSNHSASVTGHYYSESISGPSSSINGQAFNIQLSGGAPYTTFSVSGSSSGTYTFDGNGNYNFNNVSLPSAGWWNYYIYCSATGRNLYYQVYSYYYNESISGPSSVVTGTAFTVSITGGAPNTGFSYSGAASGSATLDGSGNYNFYGVSYGSDGTYTYNLYFNATGDSRSYSVVSSTPAPPASDGGGGGDSGSGGGGDGGGGGGDGGGGG
jgi:hypothetical protein